MFLEFLAADLETFILMLLRNFEISDKAVTFIGSKIASISDFERVPVDNFNFESPIVDAFRAFFWLFFKEKLGLGFFFNAFLLCVHTLYQTKDYIISILIGVFDSIKERDKSFFFISDIFDDTFKGFFSIVIIDFMGT